MSSFAELKKQADFTKLDGQRCSVLSCLDTLKVSMKALPTDKPSLRSFNRLEKAIEDELTNLTTIDKKITVWFRAKGGEMIDSEFVEYKNESATMITALEATQNAYYDILEQKSLIHKEVKTDPSPELLGILQTLSDTQKLAIEAQKSATKKRRKDADQPKFDPHHAKGDPLAFKSFLQKFNQYVVDCENDSERLSWLQSSCKGDAYQLICKLSLNADNYDSAIKLLKSHYYNQDRILDKLIQKVVKFNITNLNKDFSNFSSSMVSLQVYLEELKSEHAVDFSAGAAEKLVRHIVHHALPGAVLDEYRNVLNKSYPSLKDFFEKVSTVVTKLQDKAELNSNSKSIQNASKQNSTIPVEGTINSIKTVKSGHAQSTRKCLFCGSTEHMSSLCNKFYTVETRRQAYNQKYKKDGCKKCIVEHGGNQCLSCQTKDCTDIKGHGTLACPIKLALVEPKKSKTVNVVNINQLNKMRAVALPTAMVLVESNVKDSSLKSTSILLDCAAQQTLVSRKVVDNLGIKTVGKEFTTLVGFGASKPRPQYYDVVQLTLYKPGYTGKARVTALVIDRPPSICTMTGICSFAKKLHNLGVKLADGRFLNQKSDVFTSDLLVGMDYFMECLNKSVLPEKKLGMHLLQTLWGKALAGKIPGSVRRMSPDTVSTLNISHVSAESVIVVPQDLNTEILNQDENLDTFNADNIIERLNSFDSLGIELYDRQDLDRAAFDHFKRTIRYHRDKKQFECGIPWMLGSPPQDLPSNYFIVLNMFKATMRKLDKDPLKLEQYRQVHLGEVENDFIERVPEKELKDSSIQRHYLHHFPVYKKDPASTTPCRRVFNASFRTKGQISLNDAMLKGPILTPNILKVLMRLRIRKYLMCADVSKAFPRVLLRMLDRNFTCFFVRSDWENANSPVECWRFKVVMFGSSSSPFLLNATIIHLFENTIVLDNLIDCYVDNLFFGLHTVEELVDAMRQAIEIFELASMPLREWASNSEEMNRIFQEEGILTKSKTCLKTLGYDWNFAEDKWTLAQVSFETENVSKQILLSNICSVYDPLGLVNPALVSARILVQKCWEIGIQWKTTLPPELTSEWLELGTSLTQALKLRHDRFTGIDPSEEVSLHVFGDAGEKSIGAVAYLVSGKKTCMFASKMKICPMKYKSFTIPRKELVALCIAVRLARFIVSSVEGLLTFNSVNVWSDSSTALTWVLAGVPHLEVWIRNRVTEVTKVIDTLSIKLCYIITHNNPADCLTKHVPGALSSSLWNDGPEILMSPADWILYKIPQGKRDEIPVYVGHVGVSEGYSIPVKDVVNFSSWDTLIQATAQTLSSQDIGVDLRLKAEVMWYKELQSKYFSDVLAYLNEIGTTPAKHIVTKRIMREKKLVAPSICINLNLFVDSKGIVRLHTSLAGCESLSYDIKFPILLPRDDHVTRLLVKHIHTVNGHAGMQQTWSCVRLQFWIPKLGKVVSQIIKSCVNCKMFFSRHYHVPNSPPLPEFRCDQVDAFSHSGVDMTGHFYVKLGNETVKRWVILFSCVSTRAIHLEIVEDASSEAFCRAFIRFSSRRGVPKLIISDNGTNLKLFSEDLLSISGDAFTKDLLSKEKVKWDFIPVRSAFMGGIYERLIGLWKNLLKRTIGHKLLSLDEFQTVVAYTEAACNDRPLYYFSRQDTGTHPLTPNMLIFGKNIRQCSVSDSALDLADPDYKFGSPGHLNRTCKKLKSTLLHMRKVWCQEYLLALRDRDQQRNRNSPGNKYVLVPVVGDAVIFTVGSKVKIGRIVELVPSSDEQIRKVKVESEGHVSLHAVANLRKVEGDDQLSTEADILDDPDSEDVRIDGEVVPLVSNSGLASVVGRPKRAAALRAQQDWLGQFLLSVD